MSQWDTLRKLRSLTEGERGGTEVLSLQFTGILRVSLNSTKVSPRKWSIFNTTQPKQSGVPIFKLQAFDSVLNLRLEAF